MKLNIMRLLLISLFLSINVTVSAQTHLKDEIDSYLDSVVNNTYLPGVVAIVVNRDGVLYRGAFGMQNMALNIPMQGDTIFRIASMTKPITSVAVQQLIESGSIELNDPISDYLPSFKNRQVIDSFSLDTGDYTTRPASSEITIQHLLTHTAGFGYTFSNTTLAKIAGAQGFPSTTDLPLLHDPGTRWTYGENTRVLGYLVESVTNQSLDTYLQSHIFAPLGMTDTSYVVPESKHDRVVTNHRKSGDELTELDNPAMLEAPDNGDAGLFSTADDYVKFIQMFLNSGISINGNRILSADSVKSMGENHIGQIKVELQPAAISSFTEPFPIGAGIDSFGLGFQITSPHDDNNRRSPGSLSWAGLYNTEFWIDPQKGIGAVLLMQFLPFYDAVAIEVLQEFERLIYESI